MVRRLQGERALHAGPADGGSDVRPFPSRPVMAWPDTISWSRRKRRAQIFAKNSPFLFRYKNFYFWAAI